MCQIIQMEFQLKCLFSKKSLKIKNKYKIKFILKNVFLASDY